MTGLAVSAQGFQGRRIFICLLLLGSCPESRAADCNANCIDDALEIERSVSDCDRNGILDECEVTGGFVESPLLEPGGVPQSLAVADIDGDGRADAATGNSSGRGTGMTIHWSTASGDLDGAASYMVRGALPQTLLLHDIDGDGDLDLAIASRPSDLDCGERPPGRVHVLENRGGRVFGPPAAFETGHDPRALAAGDLDGDGDVDLATAHDGEAQDAAGSISLLRSRGDLSFAAPLRMDAPEARPRGIVLADLDGDGDQDVSSVHDSGVLLHLRNDGAGTFVQLARVETGQPLDWIGSAPLDSDGDIDLIAGRTNRHGDPGSLLVLRNEGGNGFGTESLEGGSAPATAVDLDGDGAPELVAVRERRLHVLRSAGNAVFDELEVYEPPGREGLLAGACRMPDGRVDIFVAGDSRLARVPTAGGRPRLPVSVSGIARPLGAGDFDGDGDIDLAALDTVAVPPELEVHGNSGDGTFPPGAVRVSPVPEVSIESLAAGDVDGDGGLDLVVKAFATSGMQVFRNRGDATFDPVPESHGPGGPENFEARGIALADLDGDGDLDAVLSGTPGVRLFTNLGAGGFELGATLVLGSPPVSIAAGDLDRDGDIDVVTGNTPVHQRSNVSVFTNPGDGMFPPARNHAVPLPPKWLDLGDLDRDGYLDIVSSGPSLLPSSGNSGFAEPRLVSHEFNCPGALADVDGDGFLDVVMGKGRLHRNRGDGTLSPAAGSEDCNGLTRLLAADLDGDGDRDLVEGFDGFSVAFNEGDGTLPYPATRWAPHAYGELDPVDVDGDGDTDVVLAGGAHVALLENAERGRYSSAAWRSFDWSIFGLASGDLDGDGWADQAVIQSCRISPCANLALIFNSSFAEARIETLSLEAVLGRTQGSSTSSLSARDLDGDGDMDLFGAVGMYQGSAAFGIYSVLNQGSREFTPARLPGLPLPTFSLDAGDMDRDGDLDLVTAGLSIFRNRGDASFDAPTSAATDGYRGLCLGDLDVDGDIDAVAGDLVFMNTGDGSLLERSRLKHPVGGHAAPADLDGDGDPDLVAYADNGGTKMIVVHGNDGSGSFEASLHLPAGRLHYPKRLHLADVDGDGRPEILDDSAGGLTVHYNRLSSPLEPGKDLDSTGRLDACEVPFTRGDVNADSILDMADAISILRYLFLGDGPPPCMETADVDNDGRVIQVDAMHILRHLFLGGSPPYPPRECGLDPDPEVDCESHAAC